MSETRFTWLTWGSKTLLTITDQGLIGGSNFLIAILLARAVTPSDYGAYALAFEIFMVLTLAYSCLVLEPMLVFGSSYYRTVFGAYFRILFRLHFAVVLVITSIMGVATWAVYHFGRPSGLPAALLGATIAVPCLLLFWLTRRVFYVELDSASAACGSLVYGIVLISGIFVCYAFHWLSSLAVFVLMASGGLAASAFLRPRLRSSFLTASFPIGMRSVAKQHWTYGRWALAGALASWISGNIYYLLLSSMHGLADVGRLKGALNLSAPVGQLFAAVSMLALPYAARTYMQSGISGVVRLSWRLALIYAGGAMVYWAALWCLKGPVIGYLYNGKYTGIGRFVPVVAIGSVFRIATVVQVLSLKASLSPFRSFVAFCCAAVFGCVFGTPAIWLLGITGALWSYALSGVISFICSSFLLIRMAGSDQCESIGLTVAEYTPAATVGD